MVFRFSLFVCSHIDACSLNENVVWDDSVLFEFVLLVETCAKTLILWKLYIVESFLLNIFVDKPYNMTNKCAVSI